MITIIHGDDIAASRIFLTDVKKRSKSQTTFYSETFEFAKLIQLVEGTGLFESENTIIFEEFLLRKKGENSQLVDYVLNNSKTNDFYFWESKQLTATQLSPFKQFTIKLFTVPQSIFSFLDSIKPKDSKNIITYFHIALKPSDIDFLFHMIVRQFRLMIAVLDSKDASIDETARLAPWQQSKLKKQAVLFGKESLISLYKKLNTLELQQKTSTLPGGMETQIDFFLLSI